MAGVRPALRRSLWAAAADIPVTLGTVVYRPASSHQPSPAATTTAAAAHARRRGGGDVAEPAAEQQPLQPWFGLRRVPGRLPGAGVGGIAGGDDERPVGGRPVRLRRGLRRRRRPGAVARPPKRLPGR